MKNREYVVVALFVLVAVAASSLVLFSLPVALVVIAALTVAILVFFKPFYGLILYIVLLYIRPQDFVPALEKMRVMLVLAVVIILSFSIHHIFTKRKISLFQSRQSIIMLALLILVPVSNLANLQFKEAWEGFNDFLTLFLLFFMIVSIMEDSRKVRALAWTLVVCTAIICVNGIIQHFRGFDLIGNIPEVDGRIRWIGIFGDPNDFALLINSFFPFVLVRFFEKGIGVTQGLLLLIVGTINILAIYYTGSRGGFIALLLILAFFAFKRWGLVRGLVIGAVFFAAAIAIAPGRFMDLSPHGASASGRIYAWIDGLVMLRRRPLFGVGFDRFTIVHGRAAHSAFIECMAELGLAGYLAWISIIFTSFKDISHVIGTSSSESLVKYAKVFQLSLVGFLGSAFFLSQAYSPVFYILVAFATKISAISDPAIKRPSLLSAGELIRVGLIIGGSIAAYKLLAMIYI
jgi:putative inorganic carbon (HCO3(-)) transporter